jgi:glycosyltransferase 2 family protein
MEESPKTGLRDDSGGQSPKSKTRKWLFLLLKIVVSVVCLWYVSTRIDFQKTGEALKEANAGLLALALLAFIISKLISAVRLNIYFSNINIHLPAWQNIRLYWLGMFYNLFLPGSISGDAYKVILLKKQYNAPYKKTSAAVLLDRFSGLLGLGLIGAAYGLMVLDNNFYIAVLVGGSVAGVILFYFITRLYFRNFLPSFFSTLLLGILVQGAQVICAYLIMAALNIPSHVHEYIFIFLASSVASVLPLTVVGVGIREVVFLEGARYFKLGTESVSVVISILFFLITLVVSLVGIIYVFKNPLRTGESRLP